MLSISEIQAFINEDKSSKKKQLAQEANRYYEGENDILQYKVLYYNGDGDLVEDKQHTNVKIPHNFFAELVDQKTQYILSGDDPIIKTDYPELQKELDKYFDDDFKTNLSDVITYGSIAGNSYMYRYADENGKSKFEFADGTGIIDIESKYTSDGKKYFIYYYVDRVVKDKRIEKILLCDDNYTYFFEKIDEQITEDKSQKINPRPHIVYEPDKNGNIEDDTFGERPFFKYKNNRKENSELKPIKALIDDYDMQNCSLSNNLNSPEVLYFVKGLDGEESLDKFITNVRTKKTMIAPETADIQVKEISIPYEARKIKMELDEQNIYRFGMGLNTSQTGDGNITNVVIKSRYSLLELKCNKAEMQLKQFLKKIVKVVIDEINKDHNWDYNLQDVYFDFKREILVNELDNAQIAQTKAQTRQVEINTILNIASLIDNKTALELICEAQEIEGDKAQETIAQAKDEPEKELDETMQNVENIPVENMV